MNVVQITVSALLLLLVSPRISAEDHVPGTYDQIVLRLLQETAHAVPLRTTQLSDVSPNYVLDTPVGKTWTEALSISLERYPNDAQKRALFLWPLVKNGMAYTNLSDLGLPETGNSTGLGGGYSVSYGLDIGEPIPVTLTFMATETEARHSLIVNRQGDAKAYITFWIGGKSDDSKSVLGSGTLSVTKPNFRNMDFDRMDFSADGSLSRYLRYVKFKESNVQLKFGGNTTGINGSDFYHASVRINGKDIETISYLADFTIKERSVMHPDTGKIHYCETYTDGKLKRRSYYGFEQTEKGTSSIILRSENF